MSNHLKKTEDKKYDEIRTCFQHDVDQIIYSESFRRLAGKMQLATAIMGEDYRNRLTHSLEVDRIAHHISVKLNLNLELTRSIALGHDLGHTPFGHSGERALDKILLNFNLSGFSHSYQSYRICKYLLNNITEETKIGVKNHTFDLSNYYVDDLSDYTPESQVVRISDTMAFINSDIEDGKKLNIITQKQLNSLTKKKLPNGTPIYEIPDKRFMDLITSESRDRIRIFEDLIINSNKNEAFRKGILIVDEKLLQIFSIIKENIINKIYQDEEINYKDLIAERIITDVYNHIFHNINKEDNVVNNFKEWGKNQLDIIIKNNEDEDKIKEKIDLERTNIIHRQIADYIAYLTDQELYDIWTSLYIYKRRNKKKQLE